MTNLITVEEFTTLRNISKKVDIAKVNESIALAQQSDLFDTLGGFYYDLLKNVAETSYSDLLNGSEFEYEGETYFHVGIKSFLADLVFARYIYNINVNLTPFGAQQKFTQDSTGIDRNVIKDLSKQAQIDGSIKFKIIQKYLLSKPNVFSRYCKGQSNDTGFGGVKISKL